MFKKFKYTENHFFEKFIHKLILIYQKHFSMKCDKIIDLYVLTAVIKKNERKIKNRRKYRNQNITILNRNECQRHKKH